MYELVGELYDDRTRPRVARIHNYKHNLTHLKVNIIDLSSNPFNLTHLKSNNLHTFDLWIKSTPFSPEATQKLHAFLLTYERS